MLHKILESYEKWYLLMYIKANVKQYDPKELVAVYIL